MDDIIVKGTSFEEHLHNLKQIFHRLRNASLKLSPKKCVLFHKEVTFLGHIVSKQGIATDPRKTEAVRSWSVPKNLRQLRSFLGLCSYYRRFIKDFSTVAKPLHKLTEKSVKFVWDSVCQESFSQLKELW